MKFDIRSHASLQFAFCLALLGAPIALFAAVYIPRGQDASALRTSAATIATMDEPLLFAYGTWEKRTKIENHALVLSADGLSPQGGGGANVTLNLSASRDASPALRVKVGPTNTLKILRLMLKDTDGGGGTWDFELPTSATNDFVTLTPRAGASLSNPNAVEKTGRPNLSKILQWQLVGDWGGTGAVDVTVDSVLAIAPDTNVLAARRQESARLDAERQKAEQQRIADRATYGKVGANSPRVTHIYAAAPDLLAIEIEAGRILPSRHTKYVSQPGDERISKDRGFVLKRGGQEIGVLVGPKHDALTTYEIFEGDPLLLSEADDADNYRIAQAPLPTIGDAGLADATPATAVYRKSKPVDWRQPGNEQFVMRHVVYLKMTKPLEASKSYVVTVKNVNVRTSTVPFVFRAASIRSESVHVNMVGFRPDDPMKRGFLSLWKGNGGGHDFPEGLTFRVVRHLPGTASDGKTVYKGTVGAAWPESKKEKMFREENFSKTAVAPMNFSELKMPGRYRLVVDSVGCSYPFSIDNDETWAKAFRTQMRGFYNQRSGVPLGKPYASIEKPRDFHPQDTPVYQSTYSALDGPTEGDGPEKGSIGKTVAGAWGGWHDAGDWNPRRVTHMRTTVQNMFELIELFPNYFRKQSWNIPKDSPAPDLLNEARWELSLFRRLQSKDGGVSFGIETHGDPGFGEVSWNQNLPAAYVFAPDCWSSYIYAGIAAQASVVLARDVPADAKSYRDSALRAFVWAERDWQKRKAAGNIEKTREFWNVRDARNLAALHLYRITGDQKYHRLFREDSVLKTDNPHLFAYGQAIQRDAAFAYAALLPAKLADAILKKRAIQGLIAEAEKAMAYGDNNAWGIASSDPGKPMFIGFYSTPHGSIELARAHHLTKNARYLGGAVRGALFSGGANPNNITYTTGVGANPIRHALHMDARHTGQPVPEGLTVYGNMDIIRWNDQWAMWPIQYFIGKVAAPDVYSWPIPEMYFDVHLYPATNEFTMDQTMGPNLYVWGYLAARP